MKRNGFSAKTIRRLLLYVIISVFTVSTITQDAFAVDKNFFAGNDIEFYEPCGEEEDAESDAVSGAAAAEYIDAGKIPMEGLEVGAGVFGGKLSGGKWAASGGQGDFKGTTSFTELGGALGSIPNGSKIEIQYNNKKIIAVKGGNSGPGATVGGKRRSVGLWWETANLLGLTNKTGVVTIHAVDSATPVTPVGSKPTSVQDEAALNSVCCDTGGGGNGKLMGKTREQQIWNFLTGRDGNLPTGDALTPEQAAGVMGNLWAESKYDPGVEEKGNSIGFGIAQWSFGRRDALERAAKKKGVRVSDLKFQLEYLVQESKSRTAKSGNGREWAGLKKIKGTGEGTVMRALVYWHDNFERSADSPGRVRSVRGGAAMKAYNAGKKLGDGVAPTSSSEGCGMNASGLAGYILKYAWPKYRGRGTTHARTPMPDYEKEVIVKSTRIGGPGRYIGGIRYPGIDCGGFTTNLFINSGYEPKYNYSGKGGPTGTQAQWARANWEVVGSGNTVKVGTNLSDKKVLRTGDVAISGTHTFMYAGKIEGFGSKIASASLDERAPMAGQENPNGAAFTWYRKK